MGGERKKGKKKTQWTINDLHHLSHGDRDTRPKNIINKRQRESQCLIGLMLQCKAGSGDRSALNNGLFTFVLDMFGLLTKVPPWKVHAFFFNMLLIMHALWPQPKHEINWKCKWKPATIESSKLCVGFNLFLFFAALYSPADASECSFIFSFSCTTPGLTPSEGKHSPRVAVAPACLHVLFASHLCTADDLARPVHQNLSEFGCPSH